MKIRFYRSLGVRMLALSAVGLFIGTGVFSVLGIMAVNQSTETMLRDRMTTVQLVANYVDEALSRALNELDNIASLIENQGVQHEPGNLIQVLESNYSQLSIYTNSYLLIDAEGNVIWSAPAVKEIKNINIALYPSIVQTLKYHNSSISNLSSAPNSNIPVILLASPLSGENTGDQNAIIVAIDVSRSSIGGFVQPVRLGETGYVEIVDENGIVITRTKPGPAVIPFEKSDHSSRFAALISDGKPTRGVCHTCHDPVERVTSKDVLAFVPLSVAKWGVVFRQSEDEATASVQTLGRNLLISGIALFTISFIFIIIVTRNILGRINSLTVASRKIAEGDLVSAVIHSHQDEISILAQSLDNMRERLRVSYLELEHKTNELSSLLSISEKLFPLVDVANLDAVLGIALDTALDTLKLHSGGILLWDEEKQTLSYHVYRELSHKFVNEISFLLTKTINEGQMLKGDIIQIDDTVNDSNLILTPTIGEEGLHAFICIPLHTKTKAFGLLTVASYESHVFSPEEVRFLKGISWQIATAIENAKLHQEGIRKDEVKSELLEEIFSIQEDERKRIARELHDETSQTLASLNANLGAVTSILPSEKSKVKALIQRAQDLSVNVMVEINKLIYELRPTLLDDMGLISATRWLLDNNLVKAKINVNFKANGRVRRLDNRVESTVFRIIQEAINNIVRHSKAKNVILNFSFKKTAMEIYLEDDGQGFNIKEAVNSKNRPRGLGLIGMKERIELVKGTLNIKSNPGGGTIVNITIPYNKEGRNEKNKSTNN